MIIGLTVAAILFVVAMLWLGAGDEPPFDGRWGSRHEWRRTVDRIQKGSK